MSAHAAFCRVLVRAGDRERPGSGVRVRKGVRPRGQRRVQRERRQGLPRVGPTTADASRRAVSEPTAE